ncbi:MAG: sugar phosphate isomerase/epimerase [Verrucomicrobiota bacterium]
MNDHLAKLSRKKAATSRAGIKRREFLTKSVAVGIAAGTSCLVNDSAYAAKPLVAGMPNAKKLGWRVGFATYSFRNVTIFEALEKIAAVGLSHAELFGWQKLSPANPNVTPEAGLSKTLRKDLKNKADDLGVKMIGTYARLNNPDMAKSIFEFAAEMNFEVIVGEPMGEMLDVVEGLTKEFGVDLAMHNHAKPSPYWDPDAGLAVLKGRAKSMGLCCDTGHWCRSGLDPVKTLSKVASRVKTFHLKDLEAFGVLKSEDAVWGQGECRIADILAEVKKQGIQRPYFSIEWERNTSEPLETHAKSIAYFEEVAGKLIES